jgi:hypothetical protein
MYSFLCLNIFRQLFMTNDLYAPTILPMGAFSAGDVLIFPDVGATLAVAPICPNFSSRATASPSRATASPSRATASPSRGDRITITGDRKGRPYNLDNGMDVVRHYLKRVQSDISEPFTQIIKFIVRDIPAFIENHFSIKDIPEKTLTMVVNANGNKIKSRPRIIVISQSNGSAIMIP